MNKILQSEHLKQKHTFQKKLIYLAPLVSIAIAFVLMGGYYIQKSAYNWRYTLILPGSFTMICSFIISNDRKRKFNGLFCYQQLASIVFHHKSLQIQYLNKPNVYICKT